MFYASQTHIKTDGRTDRRTERERERERERESVCGRSPGANLW